MRAQGSKERIEAATKDAADNATRAERQQARLAVLRHPIVSLLNDVARGYKPDLDEEVKRFIDGSEETDLTTQVLRHRLKKGIDSINGHRSAGENGAARTEARELGYELAGRLGAFIDTSKRTTEMDPAALADMVPRF